MRKAVFFLSIWCAIPGLVCGQAVAQDFKQYPGSKLDETASRQSSTNQIESQVYTSTDTFDKLYGFYKGLYKEQVPAPPAPVLPSGKRVQWAYFIMDGAQNFARSKYWLKIQRPYIGSIANSGDSDFKDVREISVIQVIRKH
jgi:hypothetical protein